MSSAQRGTGHDDSKGFAPGPTSPGTPPAQGTGRRFAPGPTSPGTPPAQGFKGFRSSLPSVLALRGGLAAAGVAGALGLIAATFATVIQITVGITTKVADAQTSHSGWDRHGPALLLLALLALWLLASALRGSRVAAAGLAAAGLAALAIAMAADRPHVHDVGSVGDIYAEATADPGAGYYLETLGGALLLFAGSGLVALGVGPAVVAAPARERSS